MFPVSSVMASPEGCVTVNWDIHNFSLLLKVEEFLHLRSPRWDIEDTEGRIQMLILYQYISKYHWRHSSDGIIVALHGRQELSAFSQVVRETPLKPKFQTYTARHELPVLSQVDWETQLKPNSAANIAKYKNVSGAASYDLLLLDWEPLAPVQVVRETPLNPNFQTYNARHELSVSSQVVRETPLKPTFKPTMPDTSCQSSHKLSGRHN
ncbi:hypothetical protein JTE90_005768 [Oedothorax gibbosus]|uniref:Uncharacterized protein n=1 Tax=Oedothorax gibbosus TaxID=931172 RepID=A0AAV6URP1_9ARAC|nr:hypothetical protein JTE90_005768 [Oedothorax gibbosus]